MRWISWYIGPITLTHRDHRRRRRSRSALVRGSLRLPAQIATFILAPPALLYIWRPTITPDQIWAARRFLPAVFPGIILLAFGALSALARAPDPRLIGQRRSLAIVLAIATVVLPWLTIRNVSQHDRATRPAPGDQLCVQDHRSRQGAVVVLQDVAPTIGRVPERSADPALVLQRSRRR